MQTTAIILIVLLIAFLFTVIVVVVKFFQDPVEVLQSKLDKLSISIKDRNYSTLEDLDNAIDEVFILMIKARPYFKHSPPLGESISNMFAYLSSIREYLENEKHTSENEDLTF